MLWADIMWYTRSMMAAESDRLITPEYKRLLQQYREQRPDWGRGGPKHAAAIAELCNEVRAGSLIDYGCGVGRLDEALQELRPELRIIGYDPSVPGKDVPPAGHFDVLASLDVLEHVEPECLRAVLRHMTALAPVAYLNVSMREAKAVLPDGRNAHLIVWDARRWSTVLRWHYSKVVRIGDSTAFICRY